MTVVQWENYKYSTYKLMPATVKAVISIYILKLILVEQFLNVVNEEKFTILGGKLFQI